MLYTKIIIPLLREAVITGHNVMSTTSVCLRLSSTHKHTCSSAVAATMKDDAVAGGSLRLFALDDNFVFSVQSLLSSPLRPLTTWNWTHIWHDGWGVDLLHSASYPVYRLAPTALPLAEQMLEHCQNRQESPAVTDKPARRLRKVCTVYVRAVGL